MKDITPNLKTISNYLSLNNRDNLGINNFVIPEYQRGYSWDKDQCSQLWHDIETFMDSDQKEPYFFGTIIVCAKDEDKTLELIDG